MITKRVRGRVFRLRPGLKTNQILTYVAAVIAERTGVQIHAMVALSNHWHLAVTDSEGRICEFTRDCHSLIARAINATYGDAEELWSSQQTSQVTCVEPTDLIGKIAYVMANPVAAGRVRHGRSWPGVRLCWPHKPVVTRKPAWFFRAAQEGGAWPDSAVLLLARPPGFASLGDDELHVVVKSAIDEREEGLRVAADKNGARFAGRAATLATPRTGAPQSGSPRNRLSPRFAARNARKLADAVQQFRDWSQAYVCALKLWRAGERQVVFPYGTCKMRVVHNVSCGAAAT